MKLYNKTKCPDAILRPLIVAAGKSIRARTSEVVVKVTQGRYSRSGGGLAYKGLPYEWHLRNLKGNRKNNGPLLGRLIKSDGGWITLVLPGSFQTSYRLVDNRRVCNFIGQAESFYSTAQHEWAHIKDYQDGTFQPSPRTFSDRRIRWGDRPCEIYAQNKVSEAKRGNRQDDYILDLAIWLEERIQKII